MFQEILDSVRVVDALFPIQRNPLFVVIMFFVSTSSPLFSHISDSNLYTSTQNEVFSNCRIISSLTEK